MAGMADFEKATDQALASAAQGVEALSDELKQLRAARALQEGEPASLRAEVERRTRERDKALAALRELADAEACYRRMHAPDGPLAQAGLGLMAAVNRTSDDWDRMRKAGDEARRVLGEEEE